MSYNKDTLKKELNNIIDNINEYNLFLLYTTLKRYDIYIKKFINNKTLYDIYVYELYNLVDEYFNGVKENHDNIKNNFKRIINIIIINL